MAFMEDSLVNFGTLKYHQKCAKSWQKMKKSLVQKLTGRWIRPKTQMLIFFFSIQTLIFLSSLKMFWHIFYVPILSLFCELLYLSSQVCNLFSTYLVWQLGQVIRYQGNHYYWPSKIQMQAYTLMLLRRLRCHLQ